MTIFPLLVLKVVEYGTSANWFSSVIKSTWHCLELRCWAHRAFVHKSLPHNEIFFSVSSIYLYFFEKQQQKQRSPPVFHCFHIVLVFLVFLVWFLFFEEKERKKQQQFNTKRNTLFASHLILVDSNSFFSFCLFFCSSLAHLHALVFSFFYMLLSWWCSLMSECFISLNKHTHTFVPLMRMCTSHRRAALVAAMRYYHLIPFYTLHSKCKR